MRLVIDMQGAQTPMSSGRGVGRHTRSQVKALLEAAGEHEVILALNGCFPETADAIRHEFQAYLPYDRFRVWRVPPPIGQGQQLAANDRALVAETLRQDFIRRLEPDAVHISALFVGLWDNAVTSIEAPNHEFATGTMLFDLTPLAHFDTLLADLTVRAWYLKKIEDLKRAQLWFVMSEATKKDAIERLDLPASRIVNTRAGVDPMFFAAPATIEEQALIRTRHGVHAPFVLYFGGFDRHKNLLCLIEAFAIATRQSPEPTDLVLVGDAPGYIRAELETHAKAQGLLEDRLHWLGYVDDKNLVDLLRSCEAFIYPSLREGFGLPVLEAMAAGAPTICSNTTSLPEIVGTADALFDPHDVGSVADSLIRVLTLPGFRRQLQSSGRERAREFTWKSSGERVLAAYEAISEEMNPSGRSYGPTGNARRGGNLPAHPAAGLIETLAHHIPIDATMNALWAIAASIAANRAQEGKRRLLVDVTTQASDLPGSGIARVVNEVVRQLLRFPPHGVSVTPVRLLNPAGPFHYARCHTAELMGTEPSAADDPVELEIGDHFLAADLNHSLPLHRTFFERLKEIGGQSSGIVYDLLPLQRPDWFPPELAEGHRSWFETVACLDRLVCISQTVAREVDHEFGRRGWTTRRPQISWFHLGCELPQAPAGDLAAELRRRPGILVVSVLYARKGQGQTLDAFERLWSEGIDANLIFAGRIGWGVEDLVNRLRCHPENGKRLFWFNGPDDALLGQLYRTAAGVLVPSEGEGFGLPVVEALLHKRSVLARDLPVFREIAGKNVRYFSGTDPGALAASIRDWLDWLAQDEPSPEPSYTPLSWTQSTQQLLSAIGCTRHSSEKIGGTL
jgi:glycosyltransferase involved in cell wall biosynthesis